MRQPNAAVRDAARSNHAERPLLDPSDLTQ